MTIVKANGHFDWDRDWEKVLLGECRLRGARVVAEQIGMSYSATYRVLHGTYGSSTAHFKAAFIQKYQNRDITDAIKAAEVEDSFNWIEVLRAACEKFGQYKVALFLGTNATCVYRTLHGLHARKTKLRYFVAVKIGLSVDSVEGLNIRRKAKRRKKTLHDKDQIVLIIVDLIWCEGDMEKQLILEKTKEFSRYIVSAVLNKLVREGALICRESEVNKRVLFYNMACNCPSPGMSEMCQECPLGRRLIEIDERCVEICEDD